MVFQLNFDNSNLKFGKMKRQKFKNGIFDAPLIASQTFSLLTNQILCIFIKTNVGYLCHFKILAILRWFPFNFAKILKDRYFLVVGSKSFKLLPDISFDSSFQKIAFSSLLLYMCACY